MRSLRIKTFLRYAGCMALLWLADACAVSSNIWGTNKQSWMYSGAASHKATRAFDGLSSLKKSLGDQDLDALVQQAQDEQGALYRTNWDFPTTACVAVNNIDVPTFIIDGSGCTGTINVNGAVHVSACTQDMQVFVTTPTILRANSATAAIIVEAAAGRTITFNLQASLTFAGSVTDPLLVVLRGPGNIVFNISDSTIPNPISLDFGESATLPPQLGVQAYIIMEDPTNGMPTVVIQRANTNSNNPVNVNIGQNSFVTFAACTNILNDPVEQARLLFDPSNQGIGRMVLTINDTGNLNVSGRLMVNTGGPATPCPLDVCPNPFNFTVDNFDRASMGGLSAFCGIVGTSSGVGASAGRMLIINNNSTAYEFQADPWYTLGTRSSGDGVGCFTGVQYGFVLGANGVLAIDQGQVFDYVGTACNVCPTPVVSDCEEVPFVPVTCEESPTCTIPTVPSIASRIKQRNYSALVVDGFNNTDSEATVTSALISMCSCSAMVFRSGVDCCCIVESERDDADCSTEFTIPSGKLTPGAGEIVFDVEGLLNVVSVDESVAPACELEPDPCNIPQQAWSAKIELLSLHVCRTGCALLVDHTCCDAEDFPRRDFATVSEGGPLLRYNKGQFLINNRVNLQGIALVHTDENHLVQQNNDVTSEPTYVGGETWLFAENGERPAIAFYNSAFFVHTSVALTGLDLLVPNDNTDMIGHSGIAQEICEDIVVRAPSGTPVPCVDNTSAFIFFQNGYLIDSGVGRQMILGTDVGAVACDGCTIINADAHLDIKQENPCVADPVGVLHRLLLQTWPNNACINQGIFNGQVVGDIATQPNLNSIYLGNSSNISIGADSSDLSILGTSNLTLAQLIIQGNFFAFATRGGGQAAPQLSGVTGQGGIFVDFNGQICIAPTTRVAMGAMVTRSLNGLVNLPAGQVSFGAGLGIENWNLNLADCDLRFVDCNGIAEVVVVDDAEHLSNYTLDWLLTTKNYLGGSANPECEISEIPGYMPYNITCYSPCSSPVVTSQNVQFLPTIRGVVDKLFVRGSLLADQAAIAVRGCGEVRELVNIVGCNPGEMPSAVVVLGDSASIGLGDVSLGANGITLIADGPNVTVRLTSDITIDSVAAILKGPNICSGCNLSTDECIIRFESDCCHAVRIKEFGILDLSSFDSASQVVEFGGNVRLILEPGATIAWGGQNPETNGGTLRFVDQASLIVESFNCTNRIFQNNPSSITLSDSIRAKLVGSGALVFKGCSSAIIEEDAFLGIETLTAAQQQLACGTQATCNVLTTNIALVLQDQASFYVGNSCRVPGGTLQVGNTTNQTDASVSFSLVLDGFNTLFAIGPQGFVGFGVGIASKVSNSAVNFWAVNTLFNLGTISLDLSNGTFRHDRIYTGLNTQASLLAFSQGTSVEPAVYNFTVVPDVDQDDTNISQSIVQGGGNIILVQPTGGADISPNVTDVNGVVTVGRLNVGILGSLPLMPQDLIAAPFSGTADALVALIRARDASDPVNNAQAYLVDVAKSALQYNALVGYVAGTAPAASTIVRDDVDEIKGPGGATLTFQQAINIGAGRALFDPNNPLVLNQVRVLP